MKRYVGLSFFMHLTPLLVLLWLQPISGGTGDAQEGQGDKEGGDPGEIMPKGDEGKPEPPSEIEVTLNIPKPKGKGLRDCEGTNWYGGIGIMQNETTGEIIHIGKGYPADRAGLRLGDMLLTRDGIRGEPGSTVTLMLKRHGQLLQFDIVREKICTERRP